MNGWNGDCGRDKSDWTHTHTHTHTNGCEREKIEEREQHGRGRGKNSSICKYYHGSAVIWDMF